MLRGERVLLRAVTRDDLLRKWQFANDPEFLVLVSEEAAEPVALEEIEARYEERVREGEGGDVTFAIEADGLYIGQCGLMRFDALVRSAMVSIGIGDRAYWGRGYGREALGLLLDYAFTLRNPRRVWLSVNATNERAIRSYRACGFQEEGRQRQHVWIRGGYDDLVLMGLLREEWLARPPAAPVAERGQRTRRTPREQASREQTDMG